MHPSSAADIRAGILARSEARPLLEACAGVLTPFDGRAAFARLFAWALGMDAPAGMERRVRLEACREILMETPELAGRYAAAVKALASGLDLVPLFADAGLPGGRGVLTELGTRLLRKILPSAGHDEPALEIAAGIIRTPLAVRQFRRLSDEERELLGVLLVPLPEENPWGGVKGQMGDAFRILALRVEGQARERGLRNLLPSVPVEESPFRLLSVAGERLVMRWQGGEERGDAVGEWRRRHRDAHAALEVMHTSLSARGVSLDAVYGMAIIQRCLIRMEALVRVMEVPEGESSGAALHAFFIGVAESVAEDHRVRDLLRWNLRLLDIKIVERSGKIGGHYVAGDRAEYRGIWKAAAAGGVLTTGTAAVKLTVASLGLPLFQEGILAGLNYAVSFLILQRFGWILATKQPAMTAAALAAIVREHRGEDRIKELVEFAARIAHSQLAAAAANVVMVTLGAYALDVLWTLVLGRDFLTAAKAEYVFSMLNPFLGATMLYAALTGVILWMASLAGGWFENFSLYNRIPQGIAAHPAGRVLGRARLARFAASWRTNIAGWATNVSLGFMLGMAPVIGAFLGLPFDVRHVTLSTGMFALAAAAVDLDLLVLGRLIPALLGIGLMFTLNLSVSFILSLFNAAFAYGLTLDEFGEILRLLVLRFLRHPRDFFLPPREPKDRLTLNP